MRVFPVLTPPQRFAGNFFCLGRDIAPVRAACESYMGNTSVAIMAVLKEDGRRQDSDEARANGCSEARPIVSGYALTGLSALSFLERIGITINPNQPTAEKVRADIHNALRERYGVGYTANDEFFRMVRNESMRLDQARGKDEHDPRVIQNLTRV